MRFWVGGYTAEKNGDAEGISVLQAGEADSPWGSGPLGLGPAAVRAPGSPSWLTPHPTLDVLYAALEGEGTVQAFRRTGESRLVPLGEPVEAGEAVCHVAVSPDGRFLLASCWGDGRLVRMTLDAAGRISAPSIAPAAVDPYGDGSGPVGPTRAAFGSALPDLAAASRALREAAGEEYAHLVPDHDAPEAEEPANEPGSESSEGRVSRAHQAVFLPGGLIASTDLGYDLVRFWRADAPSLRPVQEVVLPRGSGPRHMAWHPSGHLYVLTELSCEVFVLRADAAGTWGIVSAVALSPEVRFGTDSAAELAARRDGEILYAGVRGSDALAVLRVRGDGSELAPIAFVETGTRKPRHHVVVRDTVLVAGQAAGEVVSLLLDERTGIPGRVRHRTPAPSPSCILPFR